MEDRKRIILANVYKKNVLFYLEGDEAQRVRVIGAEPGVPIGCVLLGRIKKLIPSSGACFVDIGGDCDYFMQIPADLGTLYFADRKEHKSLKCEDVLLVQVTSEGVKLKSPCVSGSISLHLRYTVITAGKGISYSSKIPVDKRRIIPLPENVSAYSSKYHIIVRTESVNVTDPQVIADELESLDELYTNILARSLTSRVYNVLYRPKGYLESTVSDWFKFGCDEIMTDLHEYSVLLSDTAHSRNIPYSFYTDEYPLCKRYKLESCIDQCLARKVYLKSGAFLVIEQGETLTAIDVNSGHNIRGDKEETSYRINLDAASEIARQLRLRNISGMILVDFINMKDAAHTEALISTTRELLRGDDVMCRYVDMTGLGLMEITRKRVIKSFWEQWKA